MVRLQVVKNSNRIVLIAILAVSTLMLSFTGCQSDHERIYRVSGRVVFEDCSPAQFGVIEFRSESEIPFIARGKINKDGTFRVKASGKSSGLTEGIYRAIIIQVVGNPRGQPKIAHHHGLEVANKYRTYDTSDIRIEVEPNKKNDFEIRVDSKSGS